MPHETLGLAQELRIPPSVFRLSAAGGPAALYDAEWLLAGGDGSFAMGTALGIPRKKYHTHLNAAANPPVDRVATVHRVEETIRSPTGSATSLGGWAHTTGPAPSELEAAAAHLASFERTTTSVAWTYVLPGLRLVKRLRLAWRRPAAAVTYEVHADRPVELALRPWLSIRDFHGVIEPGAAPRIAISRTGDAEISCASEGRSVSIACSHGVFVQGERLANHVRYDREHERGLPDAEQLESPGEFIVAVAPGDVRITVAFALAPMRPDFAIADHRSREAHLESVAIALHRRRPALAPLRPLLDAADDFLVTRVVDRKPLLTVIAGYPWFADWGRDTMISLQGLMLAAGRHEDAFACLSTFARYVSQGMIPNHFDDYGGPPHYNTVDASLWFLHGATEYLRVSGDRSRFEQDLLPACHEIIAWTIKGTRFGIRMDPQDGLVTAGDDTTQLTWMDAKRNGVVFTPRHGKAVEINALWHHGLLRVAEAIESSDSRRAAEYRAIATRTRASFNTVFPDPTTGGLHDCLRPDAAGRFVPSDELRPNQIFAVALDHSPLDEAAKPGVLALVRNRLLTPVGLRTLDPRDPGYQPRFDGDMMARDRAYHNGTVWPWLIGPFIEAHLRVHRFSAAARREALVLLQPLVDSMATDCLGQITEVLDAEVPRRQQGCTAQAWSVAEVFRAAAMAIDPPRS